jgi:hypothetical protein
MVAVSCRRALAASAVVAFLSACSSGSGSFAPNQVSQNISHAQGSSGMHLVRGSAVEGSYAVPSVPHPWNLAHVWPDKSKQKQVLFVADPQDSQVLMYDPLKPNPKPEGSITTGIDYPFGLATDKSGTLYVANLLGDTGSTTGSITVYPKGATSPSLTITTGMQAPYGIAVDSKGDIFASNLNTDTIVAYKKGATSPYETIAFNSFGQGLGVAVDAKNNVWIGDDSSSAVYEIPAGSTSPANADLSGLNGTIGVAFGEKDVLYAANFGGSNVDVYTYGSKSPKVTITDGIEPNGPTLGGFDGNGDYFQSNQNGNVSGYKKGKTKVFSTISGIPDPRGIASVPAVEK